MDDKALRQLAIDKILECYAKAENWLAKRKDADCFDDCDLRLPDEILFNLKGRTAGKAYRHWDDDVQKLNFNMVLFRENVENFLNRTVPHECAHLITYIIFGRVPPHGRCWKLVMKNILGVVDSSRTHVYDTSNSKAFDKNKFEWKCSCRSHIVGPVKHKKMIRYKGTQFGYYCRTCKETLIFVRPLGRVSYDEAKRKVK